MAEREKLIELKDLQITFGSGKKKFVAVDHVNFDIYKGETFSLVGESGSGKTTIGRAICRINPTSGGDIYFKGQKINGKIPKELDREVIRKVQMIFQDPMASLNERAKVEYIVAEGLLNHHLYKDQNDLSLIHILYEGRDMTTFTEKDWLGIRGKKIAMVMQDPMTSLNPLKTIGAQIMEAVALHQGLKGAAAKEKTLEYLRDVGISDPEKRFKQYPHEFSGGMRQRVVIAIAAACSPKILICDEPTTALDVTIQAQILQLLKKMQVKYDLTILLITHDLGVVANIADRVAVMYAGDIVEIGTADEIYYDPRHPYTLSLIHIWFRRLPPAA